MEWYQKLLKKRLQQCPHKTNKSVYVNSGCTVVEFLLQGKMPMSLITFRCSKSFNAHCMTNTREETDCPVA